MDTRLLLVEDDEKLRKLLVRTLHKAGYQVTDAANGDIAIDLLQQAATANTPYDVVLTDIVMEETDGVQVTEMALQQPDPPEVILLTAHGSLDTAVASLRYGAFDYLMKPVETPHLLARIAAAVERRSTRLKRDQEAAGLRKITEMLSHMQEPGVTWPTGDEPGAAPTQEPPRYRQVGTLRIDILRHEVWLDEQRVHLTPTEYAILACLSAKPGQVVKYEEIISHTHGQAMTHEEAHTLLASHIRNLRRKIDSRLLVGVRSVGYMLTDPDASPQE